MISIITGSFNRLENIKRLINNTIEQHPFLELVVVDGGSTDGTTEYLNSVKNKNLKFVNFGKKSSYPHFMNLGIINSSHEFVCQWNDDAILINNWMEVKDILDNSNIDFHIFNWKLGKSIEDIKDIKWLENKNSKNGWNLEDKTSDHIQEKILTMNYGVYKKSIFKEIGLYYKKFDFWCADGDMSNRAFYFGFKHKSHENIKIFVLDSKKTRNLKKKDLKIYKKNLLKYKSKKLPRRITYL